MWILTVLVLVTVLLSYIVLKVVNSFRFWKKRGVAYLKPRSVLKITLDGILKRKNVAYIIEDLYKLYPDKRYYGFHNLNTPSLVIRDPDLIKRITVKDFDHFIDRIFTVDDELEPLFGRNLVMLKGQRWKDMRGTLSPSFTGNKIRVMFTLMSECAKQLNEYFLDKNEEIIETEMKELMGRFANDVIATCAFGVKCDSVRDIDSTFYKMGLSVIKPPSFAVQIKAMIQALLPTVAKKLKISLISKEVATFFNNAIQETIRVREENNIIRPDMIHILMEAKKGRQVGDETKNVDAGFAAVDETFVTKQTANSGKRELTVEDIVAQAFVFFLAGFEPIANLLAHCLHELAVNPDVQQRLQVEIDEAFEKSNDDLTYEAVVTMKYLDMVISETLRKWPAVVLLRVCVKDFIIEANQTYGETSVLLEKGMGILIPVYGIHRDPEYYQEPEKFDPERFSEENRHKIVPYSYLPFGLGPRNCIGSRFALLEAKTLLIHLLSKFDVVPTSRTEIPLKLSPLVTGPCPKDFWLGLKKR